MSEDNKEFNAGWWSCFDSFCGVMTDGRNLTKNDRLFKEVLDGANISVVEIKEVINSGMVSSSTLMVLQNYLSSIEV